MNDLTRRQFLGLSSGVAALLGLAGCSSDGGTTPAGSDAGSAVAASGVLNVGLSGNPISPSMWTQNDIYSAIICNLNVPYLVQMNDEGSKYDWLCTSESNEDATVWTITLKDLFWQDGEPVTSEDLKFTAEYGVEYQLGFSTSYFVDITEIETPDEKTCVFHMSTPNVNFWNGAGYWIPVMRKSEWEGVDDPINHSTVLEDGTVNSYGPYYIAEWNDGQYVDLKKNPYWVSPEGTPEPSVEEVMFRIFTDENAMILALENGEIDTAGNYIGANSKTQLQNDGTFSLFNVESLGYGQISMSQKVEALTDVNLRKAIAMCVDREAICEVGCKGDAVPMFTPVSPVYQDLVKSDIRQPDYDPAAAKKLLLDNGYTEGDDGILVNPSGTKLEFTIMYRDTIQNAQDVMDIFKDGCAEAGIALNQKTADATTYSEKVTQGHDFELSFNQWGTIDDPDTTLYTCYGIGQMLNFMDYNNEEMDALLLQMKQEPDQAKRIELLDQWQELFVENQPLIMTHVPVSVYATSTTNFDNFSIAYGNSGLLACPLACGITAK